MTNITKSGKRIRPATYGKGRKDLTTAITERVSFKTSGALTGEARPDGVFVVKSYAATIATYEPDTAWTVTTRKYSTTTSRHTSLVHGILAVAGEITTTGDLSRRS